jgi:hypothetical protein
MEQVALEAQAVAVARLHFPVRVAVALVDTQVLAGLEWEVPEQVPEQGALLLAEMALLAVVWAYLGKGQAAHTVVLVWALGAVGEPMAIVPPRVWGRAAFTGAAVLIPEETARFASSGPAPLVNSRQQAQVICNIKPTKDKT